MRENRSDIVIIGSGLAGLSALIAARTANPDRSAVLLEKKKRPGGKIPVAGSGQCNITHSGSPQSFLSKYGEKNRFVKPALFQYPNSFLIDFLQQRGVPLEEEENGKIFPCSRKSADVLNAFVREIHALGGKIVCDSPVSHFDLQNGEFVIHTESEIWRAEKLLLATGGISWPGTGSTGDAFPWLEKIGHTIVPLRPALTSLIINPWSYASCSGISFHSDRIELIRNEKRIRTLTGEILLTHTGLSGPGILDGSRYMEPNDKLLITLVPFRSREEFEVRFLNDLRQFSAREVQSIVRQYNLPERLVHEIFRSVRIPLESRGAEFSKENRKKLIDRLFSFPCEIRAKDGFEKAMCTAGGVDLSEADPKTMMSRIVPNLYFGGEILDIDGDTGGFNLQFAFSSGSLAGHHMGNA
ncbi:MAG: NAD(P)/FAD-dependent oxidoreductase [Planctomycetia bacterium]|nr:NAD(P)/FAD-dependent oxidoreductase [Planctomycetia bacterium]